MLIPVGMAYAVASGVPGIYGLYATIVPLLAYAVFGPSRILVLGPDSSLAAVILGVILPLSAGDPQRAVALAGMMAIVSGAVCILAGIARLGFVTELLSKPIRYGYMNGIALTVVISQTPKLFGFSIESDGPLRYLWAIGQAIAAGKTKARRLHQHLGRLARDGEHLRVDDGVPHVVRPAGAHAGDVELFDRPFVRGRGRREGRLVAVVGATIIVGTLDLGDRAGVSVLGPLPLGLPSFTIPWIRYDDIVPVLIGGVAVALVSFADTSVLSRAYAVGVPAATSIRTRRWWGSGPQIWPPVSSRAFRSAAVLLARQWQKRPGRTRS